MREYSDSLIATSLMNGIKTHRVDPQTLSWHAEPDDGARTTERLVIIDAYLQSRQIFILLQTDLLASQLHFGVVITQGGQKTESDPIVEFPDDRSVLLRIRIHRESIDAEIPIAITVEAHSASGNVMKARSWVPSLPPSCVAVRRIPNSRTHLAAEAFFDPLRSSPTKAEGCLAFPA